MWREELPGGGRHRALASATQTVTLLLSTDVCPLASSSVCLTPSSTMYKLAQLIKLLLGKQKRLSLSLRSHERKLGMVVCVCNTSAVAAETKG